MKNKFKKVIAASLAVSVLLAFTGCGSNQAPSADNKKQESASTADTADMDEQSKKRDDLYQQENQIFADHKDAWDKVFGLMNKNSAGESLSENYADVLAGIVESNKDSFTGQNMSDMRFAVSCWRSVIKGVSFTFFTVFHTLFKDVIFFPEFLNIFFSVYEIQICRNFFVHKQPPVLIIRNKSKSCHPVKG